MPVISPRPVPGLTVLPAGFPHPHASQEAREIAERGMILRVQVGSGVHGTSVTGQDDRGYLRSVRRGERPLAEVLDAITDAEERLARLRDSPAIPGRPDRQWVDGWLHRSYLNFWNRTQ